MSAGPDYRAVIEALNGCRLLPGTPDKRFIRRMRRVEPEGLTERQKGFLLILAFKFRRQMPAALVPGRQPPPLPPKPRIRWNRPAHVAVEPAASPTPLAPALQLGLTL